MSPVAVIGLEIEARENMVLGVAAIIFARLAQPKPCSQTIFPSLATATAIAAPLTRTSCRSIESRIGCHRSGVWASSGATNAINAQPIIRTNIGGPFVSSVGFIPGRLDAILYTPLET